nr:MAG TPA: hypothetical protein [Caudoviricetes sp.]
MAVNLNTYFKMREINKKKKGMKMTVIKIMGNLLYQRYDTL